MQVGDLVKLKNLSDGARDYLKIARGIVLEKNFYHGFPAKVKVTVLWVDGIKTYKIPQESLEVVSSCK